ncbi:uncharacterized protein [Oryza sativa Japonica Group]|uniref:Expressed protein n=2 Tax=Oryza sativa subsp. japonica TaxID=39947 RepID=Q10SP2_ORYSJ|nr:WD repeat-containing protein 44 [Oryza sativa Japonica Group]KAB8089888.1 hypothetical protein EE612_014920 [Oryza sativa]ABF93644.1 expressed protein [Oryza sativa Japonica Group]KAF2936932.1 hypothetical protein DAI22_03g013700 [Oryza sativa Japonica Group]KAF2936933.1 hypothetical protein DAI22_03g013700 [Oryza sativa Japonica Group]KAF2936934.1 hypothetical protein DAI22_03g013700 [Oryza sativa Japonica Group]|eukprot:NP_001048752.1 Os03g0115400 [Oryza sativa Japonica Group]
MSVMARPRFEEDDEDEFFDSREVMSPASVSSPASSGRYDGPMLEVWATDPCSVHERRQRFIKSLGLSDSSPSAGGGGDRPDEEPCSRSSAAEEILPCSPTVELVSAVPSFACRGEEPGASGGGGGAEVLDCVFKNLDDGTVFVVDEMGKDGSFRSLRDRRSNRTVTAAEFERTYGSSPFICELMRRVDDSDESSAVEKALVRGRRRRRRFGWLRRLGIRGCVVDVEEDDETNSTSSSSCRSCSGKVDRVKVRHYKKRSKELSAVYRGQDIKAHEGAIVTMKFSSDGQYLATGGEDGVVRVWRVVEGERPNELDFAEDDPSCVFFTVNENSELAPVNSSEGSKSKHYKNSKVSTDPACVVIPHRTFALSQEPVHEFYGHDDAILDLSWSKNRDLLSSSMDKTVRLWQVGCNSCLKVFSHTNYVTCVQFHPTSDNYFISGCIDGLVRIWDVRRCQVVDWADTKEIITAVCYRPDGKAAVVGTITGNCRHYDASENHLELESQVALNGRKKSPLKRIIGFQYCPSDPKKLMVTSGDSQVRILDGLHVISNYKGLRSSSQVAASFTPDGDHIISASDDSSIYMWNYANQIAPVTNHVKTVWSNEHFSCHDVAIAIPWNASQTRNSISLACSITSSQQEVLDEFHNEHDSSSCSHTEDSPDGDSLYQLPSGNFTLSSAFFAESAPRGSATWPEEQLPSNSTTQSTLRKSQYKFLKASCQNAATHAWGQVIVAAGWDGYIRSFQNYGLPVQV